MSENPENTIRTIRADPTHVKSVLEQLDSHATPRVDESNRRTAKRFQYRSKCIYAHLQQPGDATSKRFLVEPRNLSEGGIAFLHGGFVHTGSYCKVQLVSLNGSCDEITGKVVSCRYIQGGMHEVSCKFNEVIELGQYCPEATIKRVLFVDDDPAMVRFVMTCLDNLSVDLSLADDGKVAVEKAASNIYDLILIDVEMPNMDGLTATRELRKRGYSGKIVAGTAKTQPSDRQACLDAGCDEYITKPYTKDSLTQVIETINQGMVFSTLNKDASMSELVNTFVSELPPRIRAIEEALIKDDWANIESYAQTIKGEGTGYGFEVLTQTAGQVEAAIIEEWPIEQIRHQVKTLINLCLQIRPSAHWHNPSQDDAATADESGRPNDDEPQTY